MTPFRYARPRSAAEALSALATAPAAGLLGGGTCLVDLMKQGALAPATVIDLTFAPDLRGAAVGRDGTLRVGAATTLAHLARDRAVEVGWPLLHEAIVEGLTPQLRNAATAGGNVMQRPRCIYFREPGFACNKRAPGSGCAARAGAHFSHALFGGEAARDCIAVHPSDLCVALTALDASVEIDGAAGPRALPIAAFLRLPGEDPTGETALGPGEMVVALAVPPQAGRGAAYVKGNEGFALASCAALSEAGADRILGARVVLGGVAGRPWRSRPAEAALLGSAPGPESFARAAEAALAEAEADGQTGFRLALLRGVIVEALSRAAGMEP